MKKKISYLLKIIFITLLCTYSNPVQAEEQEQPALDFIFVIDGSYSMTENDPEQNIFSFIRYIADMADETEYRIGYVVYNDSIVLDQDLKKIKDIGNVKKMIKKLKKVKQIKWSDAGLGMKMAARNLSKNDYQENQTAMIILSDGDIEVNTGDPNRSQKACDADIEQVLLEAEYPVYTIQYSESDPRSQAPMNTWGKRTGGSDYSAENTKELKEIAEEIYDKQVETAQAAQEEDAERKASIRHEIEIPAIYQEDEILTEIIITLDGKDKIQDVIIPTEYNNIKTSSDGDKMLVTIELPEDDKYNFFYTTSDGQAVAHHIVNKTEPVTESFWEKWGLILAIAVIVIIIAGITALVVIRIRNKKKQLYFTDALECYFMKTNDGRDYPIQHWGSDVFDRKKKTTLFYFLKMHPLKNKTDLSRQIDISVGYKNTLDITNNTSKVLVLYSGQVLEKGKPCNLKAGESVYITFLPTDIELELRIRKVSRR